MSPNNATSTAFRDESDRVSGVSVASRQASLPTVAGGERASATDSSPVEINRPIWAVDLGSEMRAVSTFELWMALSRGDYSTEVLVWRMGRECWSPAHEVPELACALSGVTPTGNSATASRDSDSVERATLDYAQTPTSGVFECDKLATQTASSGPPEPALELDDSETPPATSATLAPSPLPLVALELEDAQTVEAPRRKARVRRAQPRLFAALGAALLTLTTLGLAAGHAPKAAAASQGLLAGRTTDGGPVQQAGTTGVETQAAVDWLSDQAEAVKGWAGARLADERSQQNQQETKDLARPINRPKRVSPQRTGQHRRRQR
jgi:hypothetical protein